MIGWMLAFLSGVASPAAAHTDGAPHRFSSGQSHYMEACGGCHGLQGVSSARDIPQLRDNAGYLLCTEEARSYALRLPNVAFANMTPEQMADTMNFVAFALGGDSTPKGAQPFTADEVRKWRQSPVKSADLQAMRKAIQDRARSACRSKAG